MRAHFSLGLSLVAALAIGCGEAKTASPNADGAQSDASPDAAFLLAEKPDDAQDVGEARASSEADQDVTVIGRIGGSASPFVDGLAAFTIVDSSLSPCPPDEGCPTPWDYCCESKLGPKYMATVKVVDSEGNPVEKDAKQLLGVKELSTVVVRGRAQRDEKGNLTVVARKVHVVRE